MVFILEPEDDDVGPDDWRGEFRRYDPRPEQWLQDKIAEFFLNGGVATYIPQKCGSRHQPIKRTRTEHARELARLDHVRYETHRTQLQIDDNRRITRINEVISAGARGYDQVARHTNFSVRVLKRLEKTYGLEIPQ